MARLPSLLPGVRTESLGDSAETSGRRVEELELWVELELAEVLFCEVEVERVELDEASVEDEEDGAADDDEVVEDEDEGAAVDDEVEGAADEDELGEGAAELEGAVELGSGDQVEVLFGASVLGSGVQVLVGSGDQVDEGFSSFFELGLGSSELCSCCCCWSPPEEPPPEPSFQVQDIWKRPTSFELNFSKSAGDMSREPWAQPGQRSTTLAVWLLPPSVIVSI